MGKVAAIPARPHIGFALLRLFHVIGDAVLFGIVHGSLFGLEPQLHLTLRIARSCPSHQRITFTRKKSAAAGIDGSVYTHPLGFFGHAAGPTIGMWDNQGPTPVRGDWPLHANTCYAIEGNIKVRLPEWNGQWVQIKLEQDAWFDGENVTYIGGRQTRWHIVR